MEVTTSFNHIRRYTAYVSGSERLHVHREKEEEAAELLSKPYEKCHSRASSVARDANDLTLIETRSDREIFLTGQHVTPTCG